MISIVEMRIFLLLLSATSCLATAVQFGHALRSFFYFDANYTQLNHGAYGGTPRPVVEAQYKYVGSMERDIDPWMNGATGYRSCILAARTHISSMLDAPVNDTVLVDNASEAINDIMRNLEPPLGPDEYILDLSTAYGPFTSFYGWLGERLGVQTLTVPIVFPLTGPESFTGPVAAALAANASALNIRIAVISQISAYPAAVLPVRELVDLFHARGIPVIVDGAHALGNYAFTLGSLGNPDYALWNLHKWYYAPKSSAVLYVRADHQLPHVPAPSVVDSLEANSFTDRFIWTGTRDRTAFCAIQDATAFRAALGGEAAITTYTRDLALQAARYLEALWSVAPMAPESMASSLVNVQIPTRNATACGIVRSELISKHGLSVSGWTPVGDITCYFRISAQVYLDMTDFERLGALTLQILKGLGALAPAPAS